MIGVRAFPASLALLALLELACAVNPVTGRNEIILMSPADEARIGREGAQQVAQEMGLVEDPALVAYVQQIGARLAALSPRKDVRYEFHVVDMPEANAFALPGGYIYVSRGLLALTNSESELANVMAHEVGHVAARHSAQRDTRATGVGLLSTLGALAAGVVGGPQAAVAVGQLGQVAGLGLIASYGRDQEREADRVGQELASRAGWDADGMPAFLRTLQGETEIRPGGTRNPSFFDSHPMTPERVATTTAYAGVLASGPGRPIAPDRNSYLERIDGLLVGKNPAEGVFDENLFLHADFDFALRFPNGWKTANTRSAVMGGPTDGSALIRLEGPGSGDDPRAAANEFLSRERVSVARHGPRRIDGARAYYVVGESGQADVEITWIVHRGFVYRVACLTAPGRGQAFASICARTTESFRPLTASERDRFRERRLRVVVANPGESIAALSARTGNGWSEQETEVANALLPRTPLRAGQRVKIALERPYRR